MLPHHILRQFTTVIILAHFDHVKFRYQITIQTKVSAFYCYAFLTLYTMQKLFNLVEMIEN